MAAFCALWSAFADGAEISGWRGNWTGLWPEARPPLRWSRTPKSLADAIRVSAEREPPRDSPALRRGAIPAWLVLGPFPKDPSAAELTAQLLSLGAANRPRAGDEIRGRAWRKLEVEFHGRWDFGPADLEWADLSSLFAVPTSSLAYAGVQLWAPRKGFLRAVVDHACGLRAWVEGKELYASERAAIGLGHYSALSRFELRFEEPRSPQFELELDEGWNWLLLELSCGPERPAELRFALRLQDRPPVEYASENIAWMAELPARSNAAPLIVGDRIFVMSEPDEVFALDRRDGKILWSASNSYYDATSEEEKRADPRFRELVEPIAEALRKERDRAKRLALRRQLQVALESIDPGRYALRLDGHYEAHFAIVGFTTPTPCSDGSRLWVWCGNGVAACYELDGHRVWIRRLESEKLGYPSSPTLVGGKLIVHAGKLVALDAETGKTLWEQPEVRRNLGALLPAKIRGVPVVICQQGDVVRAEDGALLWRNPAKTEGDTGWCPPVAIGETVYLPWYGIGMVYAIDFRAAAGQGTSPRVRAIEGIAIPRGPDGSWVDRWMAASPLVFGGILYGVDIYATFYAVDLESGKTLYREDLDLDGLFHYNALPVAASPALIGGHIFLMDNQGTTIVVEPGPTFRAVAKNRIGTRIERSAPIPAQEAIGYAPVVTDGERLYIRGERYLYAIGEPAGRR